MQVHSMSATRDLHAPINMWSTGRDLVKRNGVRALYTGLTPAFARQFLYGGIYLPILTCGVLDVSLWRYL